MTKECNRCNKVLDIGNFEPKRNQCRDCRKKARTKVTLECKECSSEFESIRKNSLYCSRKCAGRGRRNRENVLCSYCGKENEVNKFKIGRQENYFCDSVCKGKHDSVVMKGEGNFNYGRVDYECDGCKETIKVVPSRIRIQKFIFCSNDCYKGNIGKYFRGENASNWNPLLTEEERLVKRAYTEYYDWRKLVFERDDFACQCCFDDRGGNLVAHHILNYSEYKELRVDVDNGLTLCNICHKGFHDYYGYKRNNYNQLNEFITRNQSRRVGDKAIAR